MIPSTIRTMHTMRTMRTICTIRMIHPTIQCATHQTFGPGALAVATRPVLLISAVLLGAAASPALAAPAAAAPAAAAPAAAPSDPASPPVTTATRSPGTPTLHPDQPVPAESKQDLQRRRDRARHHFEEGRKRFALRQFHRALQSFSRAYELLPLSGFLFNIGQCHRFLGNCKKAVFFYRGFVRENPDTPDAEVVQKLIRRCEKQQARRKQRRARAQALFEEGRRAFTLQQYDEALAKLQQAYKIAPLPGYLYHLAETHRARKEWERAIHFYEAYLRQHPGSPKAKAVRAKLDKSRERKRKADRAAGRLKKSLPHGGGDKPPPTPVWKRWWFWTALAAGVATAVGLGVGLGTRDTGSGLPSGVTTIQW
jgi:tetratricopeptide (TPR) repeat protein